MGKSWVELIHYQCRLIFLLYLVLKGQKAGGWLQYKSTFTNMNIFSFMLSVEDLIKRTLQSGDSCYSPGDYLRLALNAFTMTCQSVENLHTVTVGRRWSGILQEM